MSQPRVLAINDISCVGKCSLTVALPVISACGAVCDVLPTALLSTHTGGFTGYTFLNLDDEMKKIADHWETLGLRYDVIYSGYLGSREQISFVKEIKRRFLKPGGKFIVDPVLGDHFAFYRGFDEAFAQEMLTLCAEADYILPNETESYLLTKTRDFHEALEILHRLCPHPIITGAAEGSAYTVYYYEEGEKGLPIPYVEGAFHGAGDLFASAFAGCIAGGVSLDEAIQISARFTLHAIRHTHTTPENSKYGIDYERDLYLLADRFKKD